MLQSTLTEWLKNPLPTPLKSSLRKAGNPYPFCTHCWKCALANSFAWRRSACFVWSFCQHFPLPIQVLKVLEGLSFIFCFSEFLLGLWRLLILVVWILFFLIFWLVYCHIQLIWFHFNSIMRTLPRFLSCWIWGHWRKNWY